MVFPHTVENHKGIHVSIVYFTRKNRLDWAPDVKKQLEEYTFNFPAETFLDGEGTEKQVFGPGGRAADATGYESEDGPNTENEIDEDRRRHHETIETTTFKAWDYADKYRKYLNAVHWEKAKVLNNAQSLKDIELKVTEKVHARSNAQSIERDGMAVLLFSC